MTGDQSVIKSRVAKGQKPFFQATCPQLTLLQNNVMRVGFVLFSMMLFPEKRKKNDSVLTGVDTPRKKKKRGGVEVHRHVPELSATRRCGWEKQCQEGVGARENKQG